TRAHFERGMSRAFRVGWEGVACGFLLLAPILIAVSYEKIAQNQETDWDFAEDCLVTHGPPGILNALTGVCGLAAMLWLYGVAWHQPMADSIVWARATITDALPSPQALSNFAGGGGLIGGLTPETKGGPTPGSRTLARANIPPTSPGDSGAAGANGVSSDPIDADLAAQFSERRAKVAVLKVEGPRMLRAGNWRRAAELCRTWTDLDLSSADAYRCLGQAWQAQGYHQDAIAAFRKAKQYDPADHELDAAIDRSQKGIVADFLNRYRH
ncbi:MAG: tetratricopeptide repeat protein, partial [Casimicrobiaceae bacterium]